MQYQCYLVYDYCCDQRSRIIPFPKFRTQTSLIRISSKQQHHFKVDAASVSSVNNLILMQKPNNLILMGKKNPNFFLGFSSSLVKNNWLIHTLVLSSLWLLDCYENYYTNRLFFVLISFFFSILHTYGTINVQDLKVLNIYHTVCVKYGTACSESFVVNETCQIIGQTKALQFLVFYFDFLSNNYLDSV